MATVERPHSRPQRKPLDPNRLAEENLSIVHQALRRHRAVHPVTRDDLESAGMLALVQASRRWNAERGVPFSAYARRRIDGAIVDEIRRVRYGHTHGDAEPQPLSMNDYAAAGATIDKPAEDPQPLLDRMTPRQRVVVELRRQGFSTDEIAARLGVSGRAVRGLAHAGAWRAGIMPARPHLVTSRDIEILTMTVAGVQIRDQATRLDLRYEGLKKRRSRIVQNLGARTMAEAIVIAQASGLIPPAAPLDAAA